MTAKQTIDRLRRDLTIESKSRKDTEISTISSFLEGCCERDRLLSRFAMCQKGQSSTLKEEKTEDIWFFRSRVVYLQEKKEEAAALKAALKSRESEISELRASSRREAAALWLAVGRAEDALAASSRSLVQHGALVAASWDSDDAGPPPAERSRARS